MATTTATAPEKVNLSGATITINAKSKPADIAIITCFTGELSLSKGERDFTEDECHTGTIVGTGPLKYPEGQLDLIFDSANAAEAQVMLEAALAQSGDFANDHVLQIEVEFNNAKTASTGKGAILKVDVIVGSGTATFPVTGNSTYSAKYKQLGSYSITPAS